MPGYGGNDSAAAGTAAIVAATVTAPRAEAMIAAASTTEVNLSI
jgi:hypothetical protein